MKRARALTVVIAGTFAFGALPLAAAHAASGGAAPEAHAKARAEAGVEAGAFRLGKPVLPALDTAWGH
ncbi:hypothetical protein GCM10010193_35850 [Kitasatospora atroaurantiaca]|uniref:Uncharacterized protein n=1 Tax=Kitasatospora atroaurantiaca TaxID=285545 RepID=A0A561ETC7_9ACTN|nr:hypothetical protein [Kitasatospora atroaurantiaca]TWE18869.1 hypothetical protein FB465_3965 [Kitasatospora atroaurantiaca]